MNDLYRKVDMALKHVEGSFDAVKMFADIAQEQLNKTDKKGIAYGKEIQETVNDGKNKVENARNYITSKIVPVKDTSLESDYSDMNKIAMEMKHSAGSKKKRHTKRRKSTIKRRTKRRR